MNRSHPVAFVHTKTTTHDTCVAEPSLAPVCHGTRLVREAPAGAGSKVGQYLRDAAGDPTLQPPGPDAIMAWLGEPLVVNRPLAAGAPFDGLVPDPLEPLGCQDLEDDVWLDKTCKDPCYLETFSELLAQRRQREARREEFCLAPLKTSLANMQIFIAHIRAGKQFPQALTVKEDQALAWAQDTAASLFQAGAPYKRTVCLAVAVMTLCEIITDRQVLGPLKGQQPQAFDAHVRRVETWASWEKGAKSTTCSQFSAARLDPEQVAALSWGGNNPADAAETATLFHQSGDGWLWDLLLRQLDNLDMLIYPSFQPLDIADFCHFSHLPLHPVGMTTQHALAADGALMSPLQFALHDLSHMDILSAIDAQAFREDTDVFCLLLRSGRRLFWRQLLLDGLPACLAHLKPALTLFLFPLFHEYNPTTPPEKLHDRPEPTFLWCFHELAQARRETRTFWPPQYQDVSDADAAMAALWAMRLWQTWRAAGYGALADEALHQCTQQFVVHDAPHIQRHLDFLDRHRGRLRQLFADPQDCHIGKAGDLAIRPAALFRSTGVSTLFHSYHAESGVRFLDHTDQVYLSACCSPALCQALAQIFGPAFPGAGLLPDSPLLGHSSRGRGDKRPPGRAARLTVLTGHWN